MPDRYGEPVDDEYDVVTTPSPARLQAVPLPAHDCDRGWLDYDNARPCLTCRPHLAPSARRTELPTPQPPGDHQKGVAAVRAVLAAAAEVARQRRRTTGATT